MFFCEPVVEHEEVEDTVLLAGGSKLSWEQFERIKF